MPLHELNFNPRRSHLRTFGLACCVLAGILAAMWWNSAPRFGMVMAGVSALSAGIALAAPRWLRWPFIIASLIAWPIGLVVGWVVIGIVFYGVVTPIGLVRRLFGDPLNLRFDSSAASYWAQRPPQREAGRYFRQY